MTYYINLGGIIIYGVQNVDDGKDREITAYDGIGQGNFPVPESPKLHTWTIECEMTEKNIGSPNWSAASKVFTAFEALLKTTDPSRFIFVSDNRNESMSGYLAGYSKKEKYPGTYDVTIRVTEYKAAGVKTTAVPYIKRPGKAPTIPKMVTFNSKTTPYSLAQKQSKANAFASSVTKTTVSGGGGSASKGAGVGRVSVKSTGKPVINPATLKDGEAYSYSVAKKAPEIYSGVKSAFDAIKSAFSKWVPKGSIGGNN